MSSTITSRRLAAKPGSPGKGNDLRGKLNVMRSLTLVITSRTDPPLPIARYRARNQVTGIRANDLRFSLAETRTFLHSHESQHGN